MNFDLNAKQSVRSNDPGATASAKRSPAVPISVYRELAAELQATQAMLDSVHAQNQHLRQQNQQLQYDVEGILQSAHKMQQLVGQPDSGEVPQPRMVRPRKATPKPDLDLEPLPTPVARDDRYRGMESDRVQGEPVSGGWLMVALIFVVVTAFGGGLLVVRLLASQQGAPQPQPQLQQPQQLP
jgi:hypothetical protein